MAIKPTGISREFIIHPGEMIADVLDERGIMQSELAKRTGFSEAFISNVLSGKKDISARFAMSLEYALDVPKSFWLNLQANYDAAILAAQERLTITNDERLVVGMLSEVTKYLRKVGKIPVVQKIDDAVLSLRKVLQISDLSNLNKFTPVGAFRLSTSSTINRFVLGAWLQMCQISAAGHVISTVFEPKSINELVADIKSIMNDVHCNPQTALQQVLSAYGIDFHLMQNFKGAPVQGYICCKKAGIFQMVLTIRGAFADIFWFSLFHELGHIIHGDVNKSGYFMDVADDSATVHEKNADCFAANALLAPDAYACFLHKHDFSYAAIKSFADLQNVPSYIVIGRLQKEKLIPYKWYHDYKLRYKWDC